MIKVKFALVGVGGYGKIYWDILHQLKKEGMAELSMVAIRNPEKYKEEITQLRKEKLKIFQNYEDMFEKGKGKIDIVANSTGIPFHSEISLKAMERGYPVICEKPPAATIQEVDSMIKAEGKYGVFCAIGFQQLSSQSIKRIKDRICSGKLGKIKTIVSKGGWIRTSKYYRRNSWAGKIKYKERWILDGSINNPFAHMVNTMLYLSSLERHSSTNPIRVRAELYRGNKIESEDTSCLYTELDNSVNIFSFFSLCTLDKLDPIMWIEGEKGDALWDSNGGKTWITYKNGEREFFTDEGEDGVVERFRNVVRYYRRLDNYLDCPVNITRPFALLVNGAFESSRKVYSIAEEYIVEKEIRGEKVRYIKDIEKIIDTTFKNKKLFSDLGVKWGERTTYFNLKGYTHFPRNFCLPS